MDQFKQALEGIFRDSIPAPVLRAFAPLYQALLSLQDAVTSSRNCYYWRANPLKCVEEDVQTVTSFMQASEASSRLCPQQSATLLKCHMTEPARALFFFAVTKSGSGVRASWIKLASASGLMRMHRLLLRGVMEVKQRIFSWRIASSTRTFHGGDERLRCSPCVAGSWRYRPRENIG
ncbi:hypothetical protein TraAM80_01041 [Trypanosoma rangeli]|uniref:Uncharacterized protein n=1 Tax=Trypanosoma rangeli TaxID=5698 RepID=A0A422P0H8_TRYRA|nr:uncharacterized protein TraAM80_01041 [Trypanosoma rangeli]RNF11253.1 hypothetical protein TraAM80_01041 [Trypanosoma rangeli]|eukprot:RNF11253.1 hypothetical protein TraAM80_01041 [Trypanosoma rangeli]